jgi:hypothetical protein
MDASRAVYFHPVRRDFGEKGAVPAASPARSRFPTILDESVRHPESGNFVDKSPPLFADGTTSPPEVPGMPSSEAERPLDEEPRQEPPGSFLSSLPQFFVFPAILVATLTAIYLLLRMLAGGTQDSVPELLRDLESAGPHGRWQVLYGLATGLRQGSLDLEEVSADELERIYTRFANDGNTPVEQARMQQYLLLVVAHKRDPRFTEFGLAALESPDQELRYSALKALAIMRDPVAIPVLRTHLEGEDAKQRLLALGAIANIPGDSSRDLLRESLRAPDSAIARNAALLLAGEPHRDPAAKPFLMHMLKRDGYAKDPGLDGELRELMDDESREAARKAVIERFLVQACQAAAALGDPDAESPLEKLREADPSMKVRSAAIAALQTLGSS